VSSTNEASRPRVSIGVPVYNGGDYLAEAFESLLDQHFSDFELIVSDNASTDDTEKICREFASRDPRIRYERLPENLGAAANYNRTVALARGEYFKWASHDDRLAPTFLDRCVETLSAASSDTVLCYPRTILIDARGAVIGEHPDRMDLTEGRPSSRFRHFMNRWGMCNPIFGLIRLDVLRRTALIGSFVSSDVVLLAELALLGKFVEIPEPLFFRRIHEASSRQGALTPEEVVRWFDPKGSAGSDWVSPRNRVALRAVSTAAHAPIPLLERIRAVSLGTVTWMARRIRVRAGALRRRIRDHRTSGAARPGCSRR